MPNRPRSPSAGGKDKPKSGRTRKKTAAPPVARRITVRSTRRRETPAQEPAPRPQLTSRGFPDIESASRYLLSRAEELVQDGVLPRLPAEHYLDALVPVLGFIHHRTELFKEANLGPEVCGAVEQIAQELQSLPDTAQMPRALSNNPVQEAASTAALLLMAFRDAVRRVARGPKGEEAREDFGTGDSVDVRDPQQVADSIDRFLQAALRHPTTVAEAGLARKQLDGLAAQRRVILGRLQLQLRRGLPTPTQARATQVLHAALSYFFDRFSAAVSAKLLDQPEERIRGLKLVPRDGTERAGGQRSTDPR